MRKTANRLLALLALAVLAGCAGDDAERSSAAPPASGVPQDCQRVCNTEYDTCTSRFAGAGGGGDLGRRSDDPTLSLGPNDICPDQLRSCQKRCVP
jgi:hypothetical protein